MNEIKIREGKVSLDGQEVKAITAFEIKAQPRTAMQK